MDHNTVLVICVHSNRAPGFYAAAPAGGRAGAPQTCSVDVRVVTPCAEPRGGKACSDSPASRPRTVNAHNASMMFVRV